METDKQFYDGGTLCWKFLESLISGNDEKPINTENVLFSGTVFMVLAIRLMVFSISKFVFR